MIFLNSASSAAALVFYLPGVRTHTDAEENREVRVRNILKHPVPYWAVKANKWLYICGCRYLMFL